MVKHSYKEQEKQRREQEILQKAGKLLVEHGYANLNMDELADEVGISKPTLYQHFKSKEDLISQVVIQGFETMEHEGLRQPLQGTALDQFKQAIRWFLKRRYSKENLFAGLDAENFWKGMRDNAILSAHRQRGIDQLTSLIDQAKAEGDIRPDIPSQFVVISAFCLSRVFGDPTLKQELLGEGTEAELDRAVDMLMEVLIRGVGSQKEATS